MTTQARNLAVPPASLALTDDEVVQRVLAGETGLYEILMRRYNRRLYRVARAILRDDDEAEDVMQHAYVAAYTHLGQYAGRALFSTWLTRIAVHEALARLRRRAREVTRGPMAEADPDPEPRLQATDPDPEQQFLQDEARRLLEAAIDALPVAYRSVFVLRELEGLTTLEAATCLDLSADVVKTRLHRARLQLREALLPLAAPSEAYPFAFPRCDRVVAAVFERLERLDSRRPDPSRPA
jgi:RNA polymerase sigma-70 factor (ECF subfamily)